MTPPVEGAGTPATPVRAPRVLVVDDERPIRDIVAAVLRRRGVEVLTAADGDAARAVLAEAPDVALLVTDVVMPGSTDGMALAAAFLAARPGARALLVSGSVTEADFDPARFDGRAEFLPKPFRVAALDQRLDEALARAAAWSASVGLHRAA